MAHPRALIRSSVHGRLSASLKLKGPQPGVRGTIVTHPIVATPQTALPRTLVMTGRDQLVRTTSETPREEIREVELRVAMQWDAAKGELLLDRLDELSQEIEDLVIADVTHGDAAHNTEYLETNHRVSQQGERLIGELLISWSVTYTHRYTPRTLPDAEGMDVEIDVESETEDQIEAEATIELET